jgi:fibronectin-binding autotransporter adhesin
MLMTLRTTLGRAQGFLTVLAILLAAGPSHSDELYVVDTQTDEKDGSCVDGDCSLRDAMALAGGKITVSVPAGTYTHDTVTFGTIDVTGSRIVRGAGAGATIIEGHNTPGSASAGVFDITAANDQVTFVGVTIRHGSGVGGAINFHGSGQLNLVDSEVVYNEAPGTLGDGGGIFFKTVDPDYDSELTLIRSVVSYNSAGQDGGGIHVDDAAGAAVVSLEGSTLSHNDAADEGGGLSWDAGNEGGSLSISESTVSDNTSGVAGGGIYAYSYNYMDIKVRGSTFERNDTTLFYGGALAVEDNDYGALVVVDSTFRLNTAGDHGGAIYDDYSYTILIDGCTFDQNDSGVAGGGVHAGAGRSVIVTASVFTDNSAARGGGAYIFGNPGLVSGSSFTTNTATDAGGAIEIRGSLALESSTFSGNSAVVTGPSCHTQLNAEVVTIGVANVIDDPSDCTMSAAPSANVYVIDTLVDEADGSCGDGDCSLRDAMTLAVSGAVVVTPANTYTLDTSTNGPINVTQSRIVLGAGPGTTVIEGHTNAGSASSGVFDIVSGDHQITFLGVTIRHGSASRGGGIDFSGYGQLSLVDSEVVSNDATLQGGGIYFQTTGNVDYDSRLMLLRSVVSNNSSVDGGGIHIEDGEGTAVVSLDESTLSNNTATNLGGGLSWDSTDDYGGSLTLSDSTVSDNTAAISGGAISFESYDRADIKLRGSTFERNHATSDYGGALYVHENYNGSLVVVDSTFRLNTSGLGGGAIADDYAGMVLIDSSTFDQNQAGSTGEGGALRFTSDASLLVNASEFTNNSAGTGGGLYTSNQPALILDSTFRDNSATDDGGGISLSSDNDVQLAGSTLVGNTAGNQGPACFTPVPRELDSLGGNHIDFLDDCMFAPSPMDVIPEPGLLMTQIVALGTLGALARWRRRRQGA